MTLEKAATKTQHRIKNIGRTEYIDSFSLFLNLLLGGQERIFKAQRFLCVTVRYKCKQTRNFMRYFILIVFIFFSILACAQNENIDKRKIDRLVKKEVRKLRKEGWRSYPGSVPLEFKLIEYYSNLLKVDSDGYPLYIGFISIGSSSNNNTEAIFMAMEQNKINAANYILQDITARI